MSYTVGQGSLAARIGSGFGQGLGDQIPKEVDRYRLSQGLQNIKNNPNMSQTDRLMALYSTPGVTNEMVSTLAPLLSQEQVKNNRQNRGEQTQNASNPVPFQNTRALGQNPQGQLQPNRNQGQVTPQDQINNQNLNQSNINPQVMQQEQRRPSITTPQAQQSLLKPVMAKSEEQIKQESYQLSDATGMPLAQSEAEIRADDATRIANETEQQNLAARESAVKEQVDKQFAQTLGDLGSDLGSGFGEERKKELNNAYEDVATGRKTPLEATNEASERLHKVAEDMTRLKKIGKQWFPNTNEETKAIKQISKDFASRDQQKLMYNTLQSELGFTPSYSKYLSNEPSKKYSEYLKSEKKLPPLNLARNAPKNSVNYEKVATNLLDNLGKNDSILAGLLELGEKGYDRGLLMDEVRRKNRNGYQLYPDQLDELKVDPQQGASLADVFYFSFGKLDKLLEQND